MPLPGNGTLSVQGHSRPGDALHTKPKQAMIVRMSVETLEALQAAPHPQMQFEFGRQPGIHIGDSFFSMRPLKEASPHEIYLRTASAAKPNAPLKYYADVTGKFIVQRQLGGDIEDHIRVRTKDAEKERLGRKAIYLDAPPSGLNPAGSKKRSKEAASTSTRNTVPLPRRNLAPPISSQSHSHSPRASPLPSNSSNNSDAAISLRNRVVHCLAVTSRSTENLARMTNGGNADKDFLDLLNEIAERSPKIKSENQAAAMWKLKTKTYTEVRPYEWPKMSEPERTAVARQARIAFSDLKIPESDPLWEHVRYRNTVHVPHAAPVASSSTRPEHSQTSTAIKQAEPKRPAMPKEKIKAPPRKKEGTPIMAKDEGSRATGSGTLAKEPRRPTVSTKPDPTAASQQLKPARRVPGSGFKQKPSPTPPNASPTTTSVPLKRSAPPAEAKREHPVASGSTRPSAAKASAVPTNVTRKPKEATPSDHADEPAPPRRKKVVKPEEGELVDPEPVPPSAGAKRKRRAEEAETPPSRESRPIKQEEEGELPESPVVKKRRKAEDGVALPVREHLAPPKKLASRDSSPLSRLPPKDPANAPSQLRESVARDRAGSITHSTSSKSNANSSKAKRKSPVYTSSEDERERDHRLAAKAHAQAKMSHAVQTKKRDHIQRSRAPLPKDPAGLRSRYTSTWLPYMTTYQQVVAQKGQVEKALNGLSDSDGDVDLMDAEELMRLKEDYDMYRDELDKIQVAYLKAGGTGLLQPPVGGGGSSSSD